MKENSNATDANVATIEEDIEILEKFLNENIMYGNTVGITLEKYKKLQVATQHILSDYKKVLKENEKIRNGRNRLFEYATAQQTTPEMLNKILREDYIQKNKVKEILEETEITDFNSLVETFLKLKKLLEGG